MKRTMLTAMVAALLAGTVLADLKVPLTVVDRGGFARVKEPVTSGVPLPKGLTNETAGLTLLGPDGQPVPAQFTVATRWWPDRSIKWVLVDFQADCPKDGRAVYTLTDSGRNPPPPVPAKAAVEGDLATVTTGALKFTVNRAKFNLLDQVWVDPTGKGDYQDANKVVNGNTSIMLSHGGTGLPVYKNFFPANDPDVTMAVEENGPMRAVLKLTGKHISTDDQPGDNHLLDFVCRITAYAGSGIVRVQYSLECKQGASIAVAQPLDRMWFSLPLSIDAATRTWAVGLPGGKAFHPGTDPAEFPDWQKGLVDRPDTAVAKYYKAGLADCWVNSQDSSRVVYRGDFFRKREPVIATGKLDKKGNVNVGWLDVSDATKGVMGGIRHFWQTYPRCLKTDGNDLIVMLKANMASRPDLLSRRANTRALFYAGMAKTSEAMLYFHGPRDVGDLMRVHAGLEEPLFAAAPPSWYCEQTRAFGRLASSNPDLYDAEALKVVKGYDAALRGSLDNIMRFRDYQFGDYDHYGFFNFGDIIDYLKENQRGDPGDYQVTWDNGYYDFPRAFLLQWARTGDLDFFDYGVQASHHVADVDMVCYHPDPRFVGANRYCDGTMHIRQNQGIYVSDTFNHHKNQSHYMRFYLTGDRRALEQGLLSTGFAMRVNGMSWGEPRSIGHGIVGVLSAYEATGEVKYLKRAQEFVKQIAGQVAKGSRAAKGRYWQAGIGIEGLREYYELTGDVETLAAVRSLVDDVVAKREWADSTLHGLAFIGARFDVPEYLARARTQIANQKPIKRDWGYGQSFGNAHRNSCYVLWYLTKDLRKNDPIQGIPWPEN